MLTLLCSVAAFFKTVAFLPQALKVLKTKDASAISLNMYLLMTAGVLCWIVYGLHYSNMAIVISNLVTLCLCMMILFIKVKTSRALT